MIYLSGYGTAQIEAVELT